jgi:uncharacterized protein with FMN-binding domain
MRKAYPIIVAVLVGLGIFWYVKTGRADGTDIATVATASPTPSASPLATSTPTPVAASGTTPTPTPTATTTTKTGSSVDTPYGAVQVEAVFTNGKLTDIKVLQVPDESSRDQQIASFAVPQLKSEALSAQSANIDAVSGATFTSDGYIQSLQSALSS